MKCRGKNDRIKLYLEYQDNGVLIKFFASSSDHEKQNKETTFMHEAKKKEFKMQQYKNKK